MDTPNLSQIENAFQPAREITDADRFAGRRTSVSDACFALLSEGANIAVVGNRGIGKTSLARQIINISVGNNTLLEKLELPRDRTLDFLSMYFACGRSVATTHDLLDRLLSTKNCLGDWIYDIPQAKNILSEFSPNFSAKIAGFGFEIGGASQQATSSEPAVTIHNLETVFTNVVNAIVNEDIARDGILIVIDEFDQIGDASGFASFLKALATNAPRVKFCIVGVAKNVQDLLKEHASADRLFAGSIIALPSMARDELTEIILIAEREIRNYITFSADAKDRLIDLAQGHPYMIHLVGKYSLRTAHQNNQRVVSGGDIGATLSSIAERQADPVLEGRYRKAVASSAQREIVLRALAEAQDVQGEIWTSNAYKLAIERGVDNPSQYVGQLVTEPYGAEIENLRERYYRFRDSLFAAYVRVHPPVIVGG